MPHSQTMPHCESHWTTTLLQGQRLADVLTFCAQSARAVWGAQCPVAAHSLLMPDPAWPPYGWVINQDTLDRRHFFRPYRYGEPLQEFLASGQDVQLLELSSWQLVEPYPTSSHSPVPETEQTLLVRLRATGDGGDGAWLISLNQPGEEPLDLNLARQQLTPAAALVALTLERMVRYEQLIWQSEQMDQLHAAMQRIMLQEDRASLLSGMMNIFNRDFGFVRVAMLVVNEESHTLRRELHTGFQQNTSLPHSLSLDDTSHSMVSLLREDKIMVLETGRDPLPADVPTLADGSLPQRIMIMPLCINAQPVGLIYADQPNHTGHPLFLNVLRAFAALAAATLEGHRQRSQAQHRAETDALTGLRNRFYLDKILQMEIPRVKRYNHPISMLMIDLCDFKHTNDTYGHQFGDYLLRETANLLMANVRRPDVVVRYGGDEFIVLMVNTNEQQARLVANRIEQAFVERNRLQREESMMISISLGLRSADANTIDDLVYDADMDMYAQKARQKRRQLIQALVAGNMEKVEMTDKMVGSLCNMLYKKAPYYPAHARRVTHLVLMIARRLGLPADEIEVLALAALLHDVGKVSLPTDILQKTTPLTSGEIEAMRHHPALGEEFFQGLDHLEPIRATIHHHHERYDGDMNTEYPAYPDGLVGERIPLHARILKLAESIDCMINPRPYRHAIPVEEAIQIVGEQAGKSFDPRLTRILLGKKTWHLRLGEAELISELLGFEDA